MLTSLRTQTPPGSEPTWTRSRAHLFLLSRFRTGSPVTNYTTGAWADIWARALQEHPQRVIERFLSNHLLEPAPLADTLYCLVKVADLRRLLREKGFKISGNKDTVIRRLIDADATNCEQLVRSQVVFKCSPHAQEIVAEYLDAAAREREAAETSTLALLGSGEYRQAFQVMTAFEGAQVIPRGIGIDWKTYRGEREMVILSCVLKETPGILRGMNHDALAVLRVPAAMTILWAAKSPKQWLPADYDTGFRLSPGVAASMLISVGINRWNVRQHTAAGLRLVEILGFDDGRQCKTCHGIDGKSFFLSQLPELPCPECTSDLGCRCMTIAGGSRPGGTPRTWM